MNFKQFIESKIPIYRGISVVNRKGGRRGSYWTPDPEWARQFSQTGNEIKTSVIDSNDVLKLDPLPKATSEEEFDKALELAKQQGYLAVWIDEGPREPNSIFVLN